MVVYDITDENSFKSCSKWLQDIDQVSSEEKLICMHSNESGPNGTCSVKLVLIVHFHCLLVLVSLIHQ